MRVFSFGGGVQSTAALVLAAQGRIDYKTFLFCNVGADSENPDTLDYVEQYSKPYAAAHGLKFIELRRKTRDYETLYQRTLRETRSVNIFVYMQTGQPGNRDCTRSYKVRVVRQWLRKIGEKNHTVGLGISMDEWQRMRDSNDPRYQNDYPLIDLNLSRKDCFKIIQSEGLPPPPKSSCWFCSFHRLSQWQEMKRTKPELFQKACELEALLIQKRKALGRDAVWLTSKARPLATVIGDQPLLFVEDTCESGYCMV